MVILFTHNNISVFIGATQDVNGIAFKFLFIMQALEKSIGFVFACSKWKHVVDCDDEEGDHESAPEAHDETDETTKVGLRIDISITCRSQGYNYIPHCIG